MDELIKDWIEKLDDYEADIELLYDEYFKLIKSNENKDHYKAQYICYVMLGLSDLKNAIDHLNAL